MTCLTLDLGAVYPELTDRVDRLSQALRDPTCSEETVLALGGTSDVFLHRFRVTQVLPRVTFEHVESVSRERPYSVVRPVELEADLVPYRDAARDALDVLLRRRYDLARPDAALAEAIWAELDDRLSRRALLAPSGDSTRLIARQRELFPQLRALVLHARASTSGRPALRERIEAEDPFAALVAGESGVEAFFEPLARAYARAESPSWAKALRGETNGASPFLLASAWALVALDRERGVDVLIERLERDPEPAALEILAVGGDVRCADAAYEWIDRSDRELARLLRVRRRASLENLRIRLEAVNLGIQWGLEPVDWRENYVFTALTQNVRATWP